MRASSTLAIDTKLIMDNETVMLASKAIEDLVMWEYCDCGCPQQRSPATPLDCDLLRLAAHIRIEFIKDE